VVRIEVIKVGRILISVRERAGAGWDRGLGACGTGKGTGACGAGTGTDISFFLLEVNTNVRGGIYIKYKK